MTDDGFPDGLRANLARIADGLIPATDEMPSPSRIGIAGSQLDLVLVARPDLADDLRRALTTAIDDGPIPTVERLAAHDPEGHAALVTVVVAGYYLHPAVQRLLGYPGQAGTVLQVDTYPEYVHEGQLERVVDRGPIHRTTPLA